MKLRTISILSVLFAAVLWQSCSNDFELNADFKDIPIVYGFIDINDEDHYIRIQRAFLDGETSAIQIAQIHDSIYYDNIDVSLLVNGNQSFTLEEINGEDVGIFKEEGAFANSPNTLYTISQAEIGLQGCDEVTLVINRGDNLPPVTATTTIVGDVTEITQPRIGINGSPNPLQDYHKVLSGDLIKMAMCTICASILFTMNFQLPLQLIKKNLRLS